MGNNLKQEFHPLDNLLGLPSKTLESFIEKIDRNGPNGCWLWTASTFEAGYGKFRYGPQGSSPVRAHRLCYELCVGPIPEAMHLHHKTAAPTNCIGPRCVNPAHMEITTPRNHVVNLSVGSASYIAARVTECPKGHPYDEANTLIRKNGKRQCRACRRELDHQIYRAKHPTPRQLKTECIHRHPLSGDNLYMYTDKNGKTYRACNECRYLATMKAYRKRVGINEADLKAKAAGATDPDDGEPTQ